MSLTNLVPFWADWSLCRVYQHKAALAGNRDLPKSGKGEWGMTRPTSLEHHPDLIEMRERYERAGYSLVDQNIEGLGLLAGLYLAISPWVVGFNGLSRLAVSNLVTGIAVAAL